MALLTINTVIKVAENQTTSNIGYWKLAPITNKKFEKEGKNIRISRTTVAKYLKNHHIATRKMKKIFSNKDKKEEILKFFQNVLDIDPEGKDLFFTNELQMDCIPFVNEHIRLSQENQEKRRNGDIKALNLVNKQADKYPKKI